MSEKHRKFISTVIYWGLVLLLCWVGIRYVLLWLLPFLSGAGRCQHHGADSLFSAGKAAVAAGIYLSDTVLCAAGAAVCRFDGAADEPDAADRSAVQGAPPVSGRSFRPTFSAMRPAAGAVLCLMPAEHARVDAKAIDDVSQQISSWFARILRPVCQRCRRRFVESSLRVFICSHHCTGYILYSEPIPLQLWRFYDVSCRPQKLQKAGGVKKNLLSTPR